MTNLEGVHRRAEELLSKVDFEERMDSYLRPEQLGKWGRDNISGYYWYLHALVAVTRPKKVVELGRCLGTSALFMLGALDEDAVLITVDIEERASELSHRLGDPRLHVITGNDLDLSIYDGIDISNIDFLFVDTDHTCEQATKEWALYRPLLSENAIVAFDDITMNDMGRFWEALPCVKLETGTSYHYTGFGLVAP
ncbi:MAG: class I SAM-dependent methyltransferase [Fimbriimonas sp.]|nr:class I SAM-dependent methyltransferase [Fimbriimonas sp.]